MELLEKIEEMMLYIIQLKNENNEMKAKYDMEIERIKEVIYKLK